MSEMPSAEAEVLRQAVREGWWEGWWQWSDGELFVVRGARWTEEEMRRHVSANAEAHEGYAAVWARYVAWRLTK